MAEQAPTTTTTTTTSQFHIVITDKRKSGAYGTVYVGTKTNGDETIPIAAKRSHLDLTTDFNGNVKELDLLNRLDPHPFVIKILTLNLGPPESVYPLTPTAEGRRDDPLWPILEQAAYDGYSLFMADQTNLPTLKMAYVQVMLALEYMHAIGLIHRDLKPTNFLWVRDGDKRYMKMADFGMSDYRTVQGDSSPFVVTSWYRAPELAGLNTQYGPEIDIWSMGCILYELASKKGLISDIGQDDNNPRILAKILAINPSVPKPELVSKLNKYGWKLPPTVPARQRFSYVNRASKCPGNRIDEFGPEELEAYDNLLNSMLALDPSERITATEVLDHPFFDDFRDFINRVRDVCPPVAPKPHIINIMDCKERQIAADVCFTYYNNRSSTTKKIVMDPVTGKHVEKTTQTYPWYNHRIMFQSLDMFDRYLQYLNENNMQKREHETETDGRFHTLGETDLCYRVCLYLAIKLLAMPDQVKSFSTILPETYHSQLDHYKEQAEQFELMLLASVFNFCPYRQTVYDRYPYRLTRTQTREMLIMYGRTNKTSGVTIDELVRVYCDKLTALAEQSRSPGAMSPPPVHQPPARSLTSPTLTLKPVVNPGSLPDVKATTAAPVVPTRTLPKMTQIIIKPVRQASQPVMASSSTATNTVTGVNPITASTASTALATSTAPSNVTNVANVTATKQPVIKPMIKPMIMNKNNGNVGLTPMASVQRRSSLRPVVQPMVPFMKATSARPKIKIKIRQ